MRAAANRADFDRYSVTVVNLMSAPGAGKTTLLERSLAQLDEVRAGVLEGDLASTRDSERIARLDLPVVQIDTDSGFQGEPYLDAAMVRSAIPTLPLGDLDLLVIENVGDLVSPAAVDLGEHHRVMVSSVTEGQDAPLKYPPMFQACELVVINKIDLLPHIDFDLDTYLHNLDVVHPGVARLLLSARTGDGVGHWSRWLSGRTCPTGGGGVIGQLADIAARRSARPGARARPAGSRDSVSGARPGHARTRCPIPARRIRCPAPGAASRPTGYSTTYELEMGLFARPSVCYLAAPDDGGT